MWLYILRDCYILLTFLLPFASSRRNEVSGPPANHAHRRNFRSSGQTMRLRGSSSRRKGSGRIEVYQDGRWGLICDDFFDIEDGHVICRQLGYKRGAKEIKDRAAFGHGNLRFFAVDNLRCTGTETSIFHCPRSRKSECNPRTESSGVICKLNYPSKCEPGEVLFKDKCYFFSGDMRMTFTAADRHCRSRRKDSSLLVVQTQEENDFLSEALFADYASFTEWYTSGHRPRGNAWVWKVPRTVDTSSFAKWRPNIKVQKNFKCLVLRHNVRDLTERDYFYWDAMTCSLHRPFICEAPPKDIGCIRGKGEGYSGSANTTIDGEACVKWNDPGVMIHGSSFDGQERMDHNLCRNKDRDEGPWCMTGPTGYSSCDIPACADSASERQKCEGDEIRCGSNPKCVAKDFLCDYDQDCPNGFDERNCKDWLVEFKLRQNKKLGTHIREMWTHIPHAQGCAKRCKQTTSFDCQSFSHSSGEQRCLLGTIDVDHGAVLLYTPGWNYYQFKTSKPSKPDPAQCNGKFRCGNTCIDDAKVCDGNRDCPDGRDERNCTNYAIRLVGSENKFEGRVEVRVFGSWGPVCDDEWDLNDAHVACRELGFVAAQYATHRSSFGSGNSQYVMDGVNCRGSESSLEKCRHMGWKRHDCGPNEAAGVVCRVRKEGCDADKFQCKNRRCVDAKWLCDGENDCEDNSDENERLCKAPVQVRLVGGPNSYSGRVEVKYYGMWGTVCDDGFDERDASVICRMLGKHGRSNAHIGQSKFQGGSGRIWLDEVACEGNEETLKDCKVQRWGLHDCKHEEDAGVTCSDAPVTQPTPTSGKCGRKFVKDQAKDPRKPKLARVVGGKTVDAGAYPWTAAIRKPDRHHCGGSIISEHHILTAAHCFDEDPDIGVYEVVAGDWNNVGPDGTEQTFKIERIIKHPDYRNVLEHDIAILKLKEKSGKGLQFNKFVQPVCLPDRAADYREGMKCVVSGWGSMGTRYPRRMQAALIPILARPKCTHPNVYGKSVARKAFCAGFLRGAIDSCEGDSGGPYACEVNDEFQLYGIISWGDGCALKNKPGVYTKVNDYLNWIQQTILS